MKIFRSVYQRVLRGATHRQAPLLLVALSFFEGFIVPVPPEVLLAPMALANRACALWYATLSLLGSLAGACVGYALGHLAFSALQPLLQSLGWSAAMNAQILDLQQRAHHSPWQAFALLVCAGFTPIPLKIFTLAPSAVATHASVPVRPPPAAPPLHDVVPETAGPPTWCWPTQGRVVSAFIAGDTTRQGIDIAGHDGQTVRAAAAGQVVYSGSGLVGYGELIIIKHTADWLSAYAHNRARLVQEGQQVRAGQKIAELGHSGTSQDLLHFEIRLHGKPVDPLQQLPRQH